MFSQSLPDDEMVDESMQQGLVVGRWVSVRLLPPAGQSWELQAVDEQISLFIAK